jgi:hypothetical protein
MKRGDMSFLRQLINSLEEAEAKLEQSYRNNDFAAFNRTKRTILQIHEKISEIIK